MFRHSLKLFGIFAVIALCACSNSEGPSFAISEESIAGGDFQEAKTSAKTAYLPIDDSEYPYAGIPRIVIETEDYRQIRDRETEIPAKLQIWGEHAPESEIMDLTIRGRGNTSWTDMPKNSYKIEFVNKQAILGMPKDRDWALIANYADKTLMKNYLMYHLSAELGAYYAPRCEFVELYLNKDYLGVYLLTETIKVAKKRVNIPENENSYVVEIDGRLREGEQVVYSHVIRGDSLKYNWRFNFEIHYPKEASEQSLNTIENHIQNFETFLTTIPDQESSNLSQWIDINEYIKHYWVQEFSKNPDADFKSSVYFTWIKNDVIRMGPVWDFDIAFGSHDWENVADYQNWLTKDVYWNKYLLQDANMKQSVMDYWIANKSVFLNTLNTIDSIQNVLQNAALNNFRKWKILHSTEYVYHRRAYDSYEDATDDLKLWIQERIKWINQNLTK